LKRVAQKLVAMESFKAKTASGVTSAAQKLVRPCRVPKMNIDARGRKTSGNIMKTSMPILKGRATSNPRTCLILGMTVLISLISNLRSQISDSSVHLTNSFAAPRSEI
jgi:hypothetical protein